MGRRPSRRDQGARGYGHFHDPHLARRPIIKPAHGPFQQRYAGLARALGSRAEAAVQAVSPES
jgi:hypothetical protein